MPMRPALPMKPPSPGVEAPDKAALLARQGIGMTQRPERPPPPSIPMRTYPSGVTREVPPPPATPGWNPPGAKPAPPPGAAYAQPPPMGQRALKQPPAMRAAGTLGWQGTGHPLARPAPARPMQPSEEAPMPTAEQTAMAKTGTKPPPQAGRLQRPMPEQPE